MKAYHVATDEEKSKWDGDENYDLLIGPDGFECFLGEPEDRCWRRDASAAVDELNRLHVSQQTCQAERAVIDAAVAWRKGPLFPAAVSPDLIAAIDRLIALG